MRSFHTRDIVGSEGPVQAWCPSDDVPCSHLYRLTMDFGLPPESNAGCYVSKKKKGKLPSPQTNGSLTALEMTKPSYKT